jgi:hypothetical protein
VKAQSPPQSGDDTSTAKGAVLINNQYYISGYDYSSETELASSFLWVMDHNGNLITKKYISSESDSSSNYPISKIGNTILYGNNQINTDQSVDALLLYFDKDGNEISNSIFEIGAVDLYYDIYVPDFNFLYKSLQRFNPVKTQKGL